nr:YetF domain-containing protein [uncultured Flavobacterium sp.]
MDKDDIKITDWYRILFGEAPPEIIVEVAIRSIILYLVLVFVVRLLGKRTNSILTITERAVFITLGAIVAMPMHGPSHGIVIGIVVLLTVLILQQSLTRSFFLNTKWEKLMQGKVIILVKDAVIDVAQLEKHFFSRQQLFELLREKEIRHLGQVKRAYIEASGTLSIYKYKDEKPGLSIIPVKDIDTVIIKDEKNSVCTWCGTVVEKNKFTSCPNCRHDNWAEPSKEFLKDE